MTGESAEREFRCRPFSLAQRMSGSTGRNAASGANDQRQLWAEICQTAYDRNARQAGGTAMAMLPTQGLVFPTTTQARNSALCHSRNCCGVFRTEILLKGVSHGTTHGILVDQRRP